MTNDRFRELCDQVLVPRMGDLMLKQLTTVQESLDALAAELVRIGQRLEQRGADRDRRP